MPPRCARWPLSSPHGFVATARRRRWWRKKFHGPLRAAHSQGATRWSIRPSCTTNDVQRSRWRFAVPQLPPVVDALSSRRRALTRGRDAAALADRHPSAGAAVPGDTCLRPRPSSARRVRVPRRGRSFSDPACALVTVPPRVPSGAPTPITSHARPPPHGLCLSLPRVFAGSPLSPFAHQPSSRSARPDWFKAEVLPTTRTPSSVLSSCVRVVGSTEAQKPLQGGRSGCERAIRALLHTPCPVESRRTRGECAIFVARFRYAAPALRKVPTDS